MPILQTDPAAIVAQQMANDAKSTFDLLMVKYTNGLNTLWRNKRASPQDICDALDTDAVELFTLHGSLGAVLNATAPAGVAVPSIADYGTYTANVDGTITIDSVVEGPHKTEE
jgi:hypothetical protein